MRTVPFISHSKHANFQTSSVFFFLEFWNVCCRLLFAQIQKLFCTVIFFYSTLFLLFFLVNYYENIIRFTGEQKWEYIRLLVSTDNAQHPSTEKPTTHKIDETSRERERDRTNKLVKTFCMLACSLQWRMKNNVFFVFICIEMITK